MSNYSFSKSLDLDFEAAIVKVKEELAKEGFGILTEIDVKATLKKKLNEDFDNYIILGACNPSFAFKTLKVEREIGLLLPCNVIVYENEGKVIVSAIKPSVAMSFVDNEDLKGIAGEVDAKLENVINSL